MKTVQKLFCEWFPVPSHGHPWYLLMSFFKLQNPLFKFFAGWFFKHKITLQGPPLSTFSPGPYKRTLYKLPAFCHISGTPFLYLPMYTLSLDNNSLGNPSMLSAAPREHSDCSLFDRLQWWSLSPLLLIQSNSSRWALHFHYKPSAYPRSLVYHRWNKLSFSCQISMLFKECIAAERHSYRT